MKTLIDSEVAQHLLRLVQSAVMNNMIEIGTATDIHFAIKRALIGEHTMLSTFLNTQASKLYSEKPLICVDFDGTITKFKEYKGTGVFEPPTPGCQMALIALQRSGFLLNIFTTRGEIENIKKYMDDYDLPYDFINDAPVDAGQNFGKPPAKYFIDDRAIRYRGSWSEVLRLIQEFEEAEWMRGDSGYNIVSKAVIDNEKADKS